MAALYLLRHAKAAASGPGIKDHDRPLTAEGRNDAAALGALLRQRRIRPDLVLCSSALRARETWSGLAAGLDDAPELAVEADLYICGWPQLLRRLRAVRADSVLVIAHNPDVQVLALTLAGEGPAPDLTRLGDGFPAAGLAALTLRVDNWGELDRHGASLDFFLTPDSFA